MSDVAQRLSGAPRFLNFSAQALRHTKGRWGGQPVVMEGWQDDFWTEALEVDPATGKRIYQELGLGLPRKNGKSTLASAFGIYGLVGMNENEPEVYVGAGAQQQAGIVMGQSLRMARRSPALSRHVKVMKYMIEGIRNGGVMRAVSSDGGLQHGLNPSLSIIDEVHAHKNADLFTALTTGTGAREEPLTLWITTAGVDEENLLRDLYGQIHNGPGELEQRTPYLTIYRDRTNGILVYWYGAPDDADPEDPEVWLGCNPASWLTEDVLQREFGKLKQKGKMLEWRIYHLNQIRGARETWLPDGDWAKCLVGEGDEDPWHGLDPTVAVGAAVEKSPKGTLGALVVGQRQGERLVVRVQHFRPRSLDRVSTVEMREAMRDLYRRFPEPLVRDPKTHLLLPGPAIAFDPYTMRETAEELSAEGLNMVTMGQTASTMGPASAMTYDLVTSGRLAHDGDATLAKHVEDTEAQLTERGMKVTKGTERLNTSAIALVMAVAMSNVEPPKRFTRSQKKRPRGF